MTTQLKHPASGQALLTNEAIFKDWSYSAKRPGTVRWADQGATYTALEIAPGYEDAVLEKDENGNDIKIYQEVVQYDPVSGDRKILISLQDLTPEGHDNTLVVDDYRWSDGGDRILIYTDAKYVWREKSRGDYWLIDRKDNELWQLGGDHAGTSQMMFGKLSPDGRCFAYVWRNNIYLQDLSTKAVTALTHDASDTIINGLFDWAYEEEFSIQDGFRWSPDSSRIAYWQLDTHAAKDFLIINNTDTLYPAITAIPYPKVGEENAAARIGIVAIAKPQTLWITLPGASKDMYVPRMDWANNSEQLFIQQLNRKQDTNTIFHADAKSGQVDAIFAETEDTFIELLESPQWLEDSLTYIWQSERDGWKHLYRVCRDGQTFIDLTPGDFDVTKLVSVDEGNGWVYFIASPDNPSQRYLYRSQLDGSGEIEQVTPSHLSGCNFYQISADSNWAIHTYSSFLQPPVFNLVSLPDHKVHQVLEDNAELAAKLSALQIGELEFYSVEAADGLELNGYLLKPPNMDKTKKHPIINYVYGEPAGQTVIDAWQGSLTMWHILMSQRGFIISSIDNRGTAAPRGHAWRRSIYGAVGTLASSDQSDALKAICARWRYIDADRVGVWGHSGGGSMTLNMLFRYPNQYKVGISLAPVPDQLLYDSIYQERYSGLLQDFEESYRQSSPITHAKNLRGKLLLIHGTGDDNVHYQGTERLCNELIKHNCQFDFMAYPNRRHGLVEGEGTPLHLHTLKSRYFDDHL